MTSVAVASRSRFVTQVEKAIRRKIHTRISKMSFKCVGMHHIPYSCEGSKRVGEGG